MPNEIPSSSGLSVAMDRLHQGSIGVGYGLWYSRDYIIHSFLIIPVGIVVIFAILYGFNVLLADVIKVKFPASVFGMLVNLVVMCVLNAFANFGGQNPSTKPLWIVKVNDAAEWTLEKYLMVIKPLMNFSLKWINVFFIPSFIILPLSQHITFIECLKIAGVFLIGGVFLMVIDVYMILLLKYVLRNLGVYSFDLEKSGEVSDTNEDDEGDVELDDLSRRFTHTRDDITTIEIPLRTARTEPTAKPRQNSVTDNPFLDSDLDSGLRRAMTSPARNSVSDSASSIAVVSVASENKNDEMEHLSEISQKVAIFVTNYIDWFLYLMLFIVALPFYYVKAFHVMLPYHLGLTVLAYYIALLIPMTWPQLRKFAHPILVLTAEILFVCFIGSLIYHSGSPKGFLDDLKYYKTGKNYLNLFSGEALYDNGETVPQATLQQHFTAVPQWPGCGDFLSSLMDVSIVALSLPMFTHRRDFVKNFWVLMPPILVSMALTFFCYPIISYKLGISSARSIGFIGRLVTLALGTPLINALGGSISLMAVCTILSGICGVLIGDYFFDLLRIPSNDFVTRGVTLGINCGAIATAHLLNVDPRAASMSSLSFSIFGTIMVILASIGAVRDLIRTWVGL